MKIAKHKTKFPFNIIMELTFWLSKKIQKKVNNSRYIKDYNEWPATNEELIAFKNRWTYAFDPAHGIINMVVDADRAVLLANGDCDDYAAKLYVLAPYEEKYILTYFTHDLKKWHTVFVWYNKQDGKYYFINWSKKAAFNTFPLLLRELKEDSGSPWYDYHLAYWDKQKKKWVSHT